MRSFRWKLPPQRVDLCAQISQQTGLPNYISQVLVNRGFSAGDQVANFLEPRLAHLSDPFLLPQMDIAVDRLMKAHAENEPFVIFGDYDVDGITATALLTEFFQLLGWKTFYYLPHRMDEGYGLTSEAIEKCLAKYPVKLVLAVDCGSTSVDVITDLRGKGVEVIVLDHHQAAVAAPALALINPQLSSACGNLQNLCSAGLAFKLAHAVLKRARAKNWKQAFETDLKQWLDLVALGTIADMVPLTGESRIFARLGLQRLSSTSRPGLQELKRVAGIKAKIQSFEVGFQLGPRLNAAGRLETALDALELLLCSDKKRAEELAGALDRQNRQRQEIEKNIVREVMDAIRTRFNPQTDYAIVEGNSQWHVGVVGIVASRVLREFHRPTIIFGGDGERWRGSGRSIEGFDLAAALRDCSDLLLKHGGHAAAAGVTLQPIQVQQLKTRLNDLVRTRVTPEGLTPALVLDGEVGLSDLTFQSLQALQGLEPFGQGNPQVQLCTKNVRLQGSPQRIGASQEHLRFWVTDGRITHQAVWWNAPQVELVSPFDLAFTPEINDFNGTCGIRMKCLDLKAHSL